MMGKYSAIEWTHHTFNPWRGCTKVSTGCKNCYAERLSVRNPAVLGVWGDDGVRSMASEDYWHQPVAWNSAARKADERRRVFCASLADVFEDRPELVEPRARLSRLINATRNLDWLLLTKRPENVNRLMPSRVWWDGAANVWLGTSIENQAAVEQRIPLLLRTPAAVKFLSVEPLLAPIDLNPHLWPQCMGPREVHELAHDGGLYCDERSIDWVICGGESGPGARPLHPDWVRDIRDQCQRASVAFLWKQWGEWAPDCLCQKPRPCPSIPRPCDPIGAMFRCGKSAAGRELDGRTWDEFPASRMSLVAEGP